METILGIMVGIGLSAAAGFRVFVPLLVMAVAAHAGHLQLAQGFEWIGSDAAIAAFALASFLEVVAYYVPWVDNVLDTVATPAAIVAGTVMTAAAVGDVSPFLRWSLAVIAGGGVAGTIQGATVMTRMASTAMTVGLANPVVATIEDGSSVILALLAVATPFIAATLVIVLLFWAGQRILRLLQSLASLKRSS